MSTSNLTSTANSLDVWSVCKQIEVNVKKVAVDVSN